MGKFFPDISKNNTYDCAQLCKSGVSIEAGDSIRSTFDYSSDYSELQPEDGNFASSLDIGGGSRLPFRRGVVDVPLGEEHDFEYSFTLSKTADVSKHYPIMYSDVNPRNNYVLSSTDFQSSLTNSTYDRAQHCKYGVCARLETGPPLICACSAGMTGKDCDTCADNFYDFPLCTYCDAAVTCSGHGVCKAQLGLSGGGCVCETGYTGKDCSSCAADFFSYPLCLPCTSADTRSGHGSCVGLNLALSNVTQLVHKPWCECDSGYYQSDCRKSCNSSLHSTWERCTSAGDPEC